MKRPVTPIHILDDLLGGAAPVAQAPVVQPPALTGMAAIDAARLTPAVYRTAVRLLARAEPSGVLWLAPEEGLDVFGVGEYGAQRAHLYHLKRAGLIDYSHCAGWFVRFLAPLQNGALVLQNGAVVLQDRAWIDESVIPGSQESVYFVADKERHAVKIGYSRTPEERLRALQTGTPHRLQLLGTVPGGLELEWRLHTYYASWRLVGEWFTLTDELAAHIAELGARNTLQNGVVALQDCNEPLQNSAEEVMPPLQNRAGQLQNGALALQNGAVALQDCNGSPTTNKAVCLIDPDLETTELKQTNKPPEPEPPFVPNPAEVPVIVNLLTSIGVSRAMAESITKKRDLEHVRLVVSHWQANNQLNGGRLQNTQGFIVAALREPEKYGIEPALSWQFLHSELHRSHLTPAEEAEYHVEDAELEDDLLPGFGQKTPPVTVNLVRVRDDDAQAEPDDTQDATAGHAAWRNLQREYRLSTQPGSYDDWVQEAQFVDYDEAEHTLTVQVAEPKHFEWLNTRLRPQIKRRLAVIVGQPVEVKFVLDTDSLKEE